MDGTYFAGLRLANFPFRISSPQGLGYQSQALQGCYPISYGNIYILSILASNTSLTFWFMQGLRMLVAGHEQVANLAKNESYKSWAAQELCEQTKNKMEAARRLHEEMELRMMKTSNVAREQLEEARLELNK